MDSVLIGTGEFDVEPSALVQLSMTNAQLGNEFNSISDKCTAYFTDVVDFLDRVQEGFILNVINDIWYSDSTNILRLKNGKEQTELKI